MNVISNDQISHLPIVSILTAILDAQVRTVLKPTASWQNNLVKRFPKSMSPNNYRILFPPRPVRYLRRSCGRDLVLASINGSAGRQIDEIED